MMNLPRLSHTNLDLATFYESISKLCNYDNTSFNSVHKAILNFNTDKISIDLNFLEHYTPIVLQTRPTTTIIQTQTGILNSIADISCSAKLVDTHIMLLQDTEQIIASRSVDELLNKVIIHDLAILNNYTLGTPELTEDNTINISFNTYDTNTKTFLFGTRACSISLPIIPQGTITVTNKNINSIFSPATGTIDFDGTGNITNYFGMHTIKLNAATSTCTERIFLDNAKNSTVNILLPQNIAGNDHALCFDKVMVPAVNEWATTVEITPAMFWSSDNKATISLDLVDGASPDLDHKVNARGFSLNSNISTKSLNVTINRKLLNNPTLVLSSMNTSLSCGSLTHKMTTGGNNNPGILSFSQLSGAAKNIEGIGNNNRTNYITDITYKLQYEQTPEFSLNSFDIYSNNDAAYDDYYLTVQLPESYNNLFSAFTLSELSKSVQTYNITVNTPLLYSNIINYTMASNTYSEFTCDIVLGDNGFTLDNFKSSNKISLDSETLANIQPQLFDIKLNGTTSIANDSNIKTGGRFKMFNSCRFNMNHQQTLLQGILFKSDITSNDYSTTNSGTSNPHGYEFEAPQAPKVVGLINSSQKDFGIFNCYCVDSGSLQNSSEFPIAIEIPYDTYVTYEARASSTGCQDGYWEVQDRYSTQITLKLKRHSNIYTDTEGKTILALNITLADPGVIEYGDTTRISPSRMYSEVSMGHIDKKEYGTTPHDIYLDGEFKAYDSYSVSSISTTVVKENGYEDDIISPYSASKIFNDKTMVNHLTIVHRPNSVSAADFGGGTFKIILDFKLDTVTVCSNNISQVDYTIFLDDGTTSSNVIYDNNDYYDSTRAFTISDIDLDLNFDYGYSLTN